VKPIVRDYGELESDALRALANRTLRTPGADPSHVEAAIRRLSTRGDVGEHLKRLAPSEIRALRQLLEGVRERLDREALDDEG
jgi:hypothetical protein